MKLREREAKIKGMRPEKRVLYVVCVVVVFTVDV